MAQVLVVDGAHLARLLKLCRIIGEDGATFQQLQVRLKTSRRTIFRDLSSLHEMGIRIKRGRDGYRINHSPVACRKIIIDRQVAALTKLLNTWLA